MRFLRYAEETAGHSLCLPKVGNTSRGAWTRASFGRNRPSSIATCQGSGHDDVVSKKFLNVFIRLGKYRDSRAGYMFFTNQRNENLKNTCTTPVHGHGNCRFYGTAECANRRFFVKSDLQAPAVKIRINQTTGVVRSKHISLYELAPRLPNFTRSYISSII